MNLIDVWKTLQAVGHGTDKGWAHGYLPIYEELFAHRRDLPIRLLEIGVDRGYSLELWRGYFPAAEIVGIDIRPPIACEGVQVLQGNSTDSEFAATLGRFDVIIDDGSHGMDDQLATFRLLSPHLNPGGVYVIEDVQGDPGVLLADAPFRVEDLRPRSGRDNSILMILELSGPCKH